MAISREKTHLAVASHIAYLFRRFSDMRVESDKQFDGVGEVHRAPLSALSVHAIEGVNPDLERKEGKNIS